MSAQDILSLTPAGLYCAAGDFHIDAMRPVDRALVTHGHSDHARAGHRSVLATAQTLDIMDTRYGADFCHERQVAILGKPIRIGGVTVTFHPAGHVLGSAQITVEKNGFTVTVSGDYKRAHDPTCLPFEPVRSDAFVTEATFGLPVFHFPEARVEAQKLLASQALFPDRTHLVGAYALGKAQRVIRTLRDLGYERPIYLHGAMVRLCELYARLGVDLGPLVRVDPKERGRLGGEIVLSPPGALRDTWARKFPDPLTVAASGWMRVRARARLKGVELPLIVSDHSDWAQLCATVKDVGCSELWVTHGEADALVHWAEQQGIAARPLHMIGYGEEETEEALDEAA
ncbi:ligase-associated DNA damage response exonuclease [Lichenihabitans sp. Uapishka_5]|uniref:ligase-associated DNA damage response exonuclease n=1 Tax=Lichenihabitans sp. Uapishka_5 TaxID=3037302 RepID=UPI0029E7E385|nr:ligase-associated DNA damage response exonuclease [Lichenihabitans sp. Uapishka_5]MDX7951505.1 ligase-associated DNA damage response exonuclease [Lichenihabitans sp. Uapishka_5]